MNRRDLLKSILMGTAVVAGAKITPSRELQDNLVKYIGTYPSAFKELDGQSIRIGGFITKQHQTVDLLATRNSSDLTLPTGIS